jgi:hypothetical protein
MRASVGLCSFRRRPASDWEGIVASYRPSLTTGFFAHLENVIIAAQSNPERQEGEHIAETAINNDHDLI